MQFNNNNNKIEIKSLKVYNIVNIVPKIINKQTKMAANAPMLNFNVCPSCTNSQFSPQNPSGHKHRYRNRGS